MATKKKSAALVWSWQSPAFVITATLLLVIVAVLLVIALDLDRLVAVMIALLALDGLIAGVVGYQIAVAKAGGDWETQVAEARDAAKLEADRYWEAKLEGLRGEVRAQVEVDMTLRLAEARQQGKAEAEAVWDARLSKALAEARTEARAEAERQWEMRLAMEVDRAKLDAYREMEERLALRMEAAMQTAPVGVVGTSPSQPPSPAAQPGASTRQQAVITQFIPQPRKPTEPAAAPPPPAPRQGDSYIERLRKTYLEKRP